jgi:hypothetical protein
MIGVLVAAVAALSAVAATSAMASLPEFSPGAAGTTLKGTSKAGHLEIKGEPPISCESDTVTGELTGTTKKEGTATVDFSKCTAFSIFGAHSLEDSEGTILVKAKLKLCFINEAKEEVGVLTKIEPVHIEVAGKLIVVTGDQVGRITPTKKSQKGTYTIEYKQSGGVPTPAGCEGEKEHFSSEINESGKLIESGEETKEEGEFSTAQELKA